MSDTLPDFQASRDLQSHRETFHAFSKVVLFAVLHIVLVLGCLALAFLGNSPLIALFLGVAGTITLIAAFAIT